MKEKEVQDQQENETNLRMITQLRAEVASLKDELQTIDSNCLEIKSEITQHKKNLSALKHTAAPIIQLINEKLTQLDEDLSKAEGQVKRQTIKDLITEETRALKQATSDVQKTEDQIRFLQREL